MILFDGQASGRRLVWLPDGVLRWKIRERPDEIPTLFLVFKDRLEKWYMEEAGPGEMKPAMLVAVNRRRQPSGALTTWGESDESGGDVHCREASSAGTVQVEPGNRVEGLAE